MSSSESKQPGILKVIHAVADVSTDPAPDDSLFGAGVLDSFTLPDLVSGLEEEFGVKIPDADLVPERFDSVAKIEKYLDSRKA
jgi:acyl carrier protein